MSENQKIINNLTFHTVDGLYLQDNDVEHEDFVMVEDLYEWFNENTRTITRADVMEIAISGGNARRNYSIYEKWIAVSSILDELPKPAPEPAQEPLYRDSTLHITELKSKMSDGKSRFEGGKALVEVSVSDFNKLLAIAYHYEAETARLKGVKFNG